MKQNEEKKKIHNAIVRVFKKTSAPEEWNVMKGFS